MAKKSKLLAALDAHKGRDYEAEKRKKQIKAAEKRKVQKGKVVQVDSNEPEINADLERSGTNGASEDQKEAPAATTTLDNDDDFEDFSSSEASEEDEDNDANEPSTIPQPPADDPSASEAELDSDVPLSDLSADDRADTIPHQRMTINNGPALLTSTSRIRLLKPHLRFSAHNALISSLPPSSTAIPDPNDDLTRELEFYRIARMAATEARALLKKEGVPFTRPNDYFAEMAKSDEQMGKVKRKMHEEAASKKAAAEARALRDAKKFGKAVQVAKAQERAKEKRETLEKISTLKRSTSFPPSNRIFTLHTSLSANPGKIFGANIFSSYNLERKGQDTGLVNEAADDDLFENIDVEDGPKTNRQGRERGPSGPASKRQKKDQKFGFGGKKRFAKSGDAASTADMRGFSASRMKGGRLGASRGRGGGGSAGGRGAKRLGKSRRAAAAR
jgi:rRNA-processing protein EBP2